MKFKEMKETKTVKNHRRILADEMKKFVEMIIEDYKNYIPHERKEHVKKIDDFYDIVKIRDDKKLVFTSNEKENCVTMPGYVYKIRRYVRFIPGFGINKNHSVHKDGEILNKNQPLDYIKHFFVSGMKVIDVFKETLLHETMHFCGMGGGILLLEGINELKSREFAQKHGIKINWCAYPKETAIASRLQEILGVDATNRLAYCRGIKDMRLCANEMFDEEIGYRIRKIALSMEKTRDIKKVFNERNGLIRCFKRFIKNKKIDYSETYGSLEKLESEVERYKKGENGGVVERVQTRAIQRTQEITNIDKALKKDIRE